MESLPWANRKTNDEVVVLTGAGISMAAGFPSGPALVKALLTTLATKIKKLDQDAIEGIFERLPLETVFQIVRDHMGSLIIEQMVSMLDGGAPTPIHQAIALLADRGLIRRLYTLNFDTLQERALSFNSVLENFIGRSVLHSFGMISGAKLDFVKLHGSADRASVITLAEYVAGFHPVIRSLLLQDLNASCCLVLGYGGWDVDIHHIIANAIEAKIIPSELVWIDRSYPENGGRTYLLKALSDAGTLTHRIVGDVQMFAEQFVGHALSYGAKWEHSLDGIMQYLRKVENEVATATLCECATLVGEVEWAVELLSLLKPNRLLRERAFLAEARGDYGEAARQYSTLAVQNGRPETRALSATRAFLVSKGVQDVFDRVPMDALPDPLGQAFNTLRATRRTDIGGLQRQEMNKMIQALPSFEHLARSVSNLDAVRLYVSILSEAARINHEAREWNSALSADTIALRFANAIGDRDAIAMCAGNIGACYMGLAEDANSVSRSTYLENAEHWLRKSLANVPRQHCFTWALHTCNLGVVLVDSGRPEEGIQLLTKGVESLESLYPNYAICFRGELSTAHALLFSDQRDQTCLNLAIKNLQAGVELARKLKDWDDRKFLKNAAENLHQMNVLPEELRWLMDRSGNT